MAIKPGVETYATSFCCFLESKTVQLLRGVIRIDMMTVRVYQVQHRPGEIIAHGGTILAVQPRVLEFGCPVLQKKSGIVICACNPKGKG